MASQPACECEHHQDDRDHPADPIAVATVGSAAQKAAADGEDEKRNQEDAK